MWSPLCSAGYRLIAFDMLGFGLSDKPSSPPHTYSVLDQADVAEAVLQAARVPASYASNGSTLTTIDVLAHDLGATVALELLARQAGDGVRGPMAPQAAADGVTGALRIRSVVLLNGGIIPGAHRPTLVQRLLVMPWGVGSAAGALLALAPLEVFRSSLNRVFGPAAPLSAAAAAPHFALWRHKGGAYVAGPLLGYMAERRVHGERWVRSLLSPSGPPLSLVNGPADPVSGAHLVEAYRAERRARGCDDLASSGARAAAPFDSVSVLAPGVGHYPQLEAPKDVVAAVLRHHAQLPAH